MGVTDLRPYFTKIIGHNSVNVHRIPTKLGTEIRLMSPLSEPNFNPIGARIRVLWRILQSVRKEVEEKKQRKNPQTLTALFSEMAGAIFFKFGMWTPLPSRHFCSNFGFNQIRNHGATKMCKSRLLSSCKYTAPASWAARVLI